MVIATHSISRTQTTKSIIGTQISPKITTNKATATQLQALHESAERLITRLEHGDIQPAEIMQRSDAVGLIALAINRLQTTRPLISRGATNSEANFEREKARNERRASLQNFVTEFLKNTKRPMYYLTDKDLSQDAITHNCVTHPPILKAIGEALGQRKDWQSILSKLIERRNKGTYYTFGINDMITGLIRGSLKLNAKNIYKNEFFEIIKPLVEKKSLGYGALYSTAIAEFLKQSGKDLKKRDISNITRNLTLAPEMWLDELKHAFTQILKPSDAELMSSYFITDKSVKNQTGASRYESLRERAKALAALCSTVISDDGYRIKEKGLMVDLLKAIFNKIENSPSFNLLLDKADKLGQLASTVRFPHDRGGAYYSGLRGAMADYIKPSQVYNTLAKKAVSLSDSLTQPIAVPKAVTV